MSTIDLSNTSCMTANRKTARTTQATKPSQPSLVQTAYVNLLATADVIRTLFEKVCAPFDITGQQYNVLRILRGAEPDGLPTLTIAERLIERAPGITRMIDRLESKGLVRREARSDDRRCVYCRITREGLNLLRPLDEPVEDANHKAFGGLTRREIEQLVALLLKTRQAHDGNENT